MDVCWRIEFGLSKGRSSVYVHRCLPWFGSYCCPTAAMVLPGRVGFQCHAVGATGSFTELRMHLILGSSSPLGETQRTQRYSLWIGKLVARIAPFRAGEVPIIGLLEKQARRPRALPSRENPEKPPGFLLSLGRDTHFWPYV
jgi:hypothetical protein